MVTLVYGIRAAIWSLFAAALLFACTLSPALSLPTAKAGAKAAYGSPKIPAWPAGLHYYTPPKHKYAHTISADVCVYGGTACGVIAAVQLRNAGHTVVIIENGGHLGGMTAGGLSNTDIGNKDAIGGMSLDFYKEVGAHYNEKIEWRFEPHVAENVFDNLVKEHHIPVYYR